MAKRPDWVMKSWIALNINEFIFFDIVELFYITLIYS